jgi:HEPN domain-containing protein
MREEIKNWWAQAKEDFDSAKFNFDGEKYYVAAFLFQQATEKALKALYLVEFREIPLTHSIVHLAKEVGLPSEMLSGIRDLNPEYVLSRYPNAAGGIPSEMYDDEIVKRYLKTADEVLEWVKNRIEKY